MSSDEPGKVPPSVPADIAEEIAAARAREQERQRKLEEKRIVSNKNADRAEKRAQWRAEHPPPGVVAVLTAYREWHAAAMATPGFRELLGEGELWLAPRGLEGIRAAYHDVKISIMPTSKPKTEGVGIRVTKAATLELILFYKGVQSQGRFDLANPDYLRRWSPESLERFAEYLRAGIWEDFRLALKERG